MLYCMCWHKEEDGKRRSSHCKFHARSPNAFLPPSPPPSFLAFPIQHFSFFSVFFLPLPSPPFPPPPGDSISRWRKRRKNCPAHFVPPLLSLRKYLGCCSLPTFSSGEPESEKKNLLHSSFPPPMPLLVPAAAAGHLLDVEDAETGKRRIFGDLFVYRTRQSSISERGILLLLSVFSTGGR